ncbi:hypothetical protein QP179_14225 [Sphingomonas aurantiaca]|uniref:hypothetical protein n=1 Tax=Sphingomonas aurantiaca TaxID=185949 RepID=UPI002FDFFDC5
MRLDARIKRLERHTKTDTLDVDRIELVGMGTDLMAVSTVQHDGCFSTFVIVTNAAGVAA